MTHLQMLTRYKSWANALLFSAASELPKHELTATRPIVFGNILRTFNHVYAMDQVWQAHLQGRRHGRTTRNPEACPSLNELRIAQKNMDGWYIDYADSLSDADCSQIVEFSFISDGAGSMSREAIVLHVVNHSTYHRGHIADMMYDCSVVPPTTDLPVFLKSACPLSCRESNLPN